MAFAVEGRVAKFCHSPLDATQRRGIPATERLRAM
jgi:hypothetical protein